MKNLNKAILPVSIGLLGILILSSCGAKIPKGATAVQGFNSKKFLEKWYEIARFDYRFEKNLNNVTAEYSNKPNGNIEVKNRGYDYVKNEWKESIGEARFVNEPTEGRLKVSFFKPIWSGYNVIDIDENYTYALIAGNNLDYLWILSREKTLPDSYKQRFLEKAKALGYKTENLIWVEQN
ncbi:lipocalin family protein [Kaistella palustris]|uniref:lipocalin family protein n=1 Tax=Kaistella palustris TaxID=493376 RepID=UPI00040AFA76|nr:lipocalin family protein [Kaistella palustris]